MNTYSKVLSDNDVQVIFETYDGDSVNFTSLGRKYDVDPKTVKRVYNLYSQDVKKSIEEEPSPEEELVEYVLDDMFEFDDVLEFDDDVEESYDEVEEYNFVMTSDSIVITKSILNDQGYASSSHQETITVDNPNFREVFLSIMDEKGSEESLKDAFFKISIKERLEASNIGRVFADPARGIVEVKDETSGVMYKLPMDLSSRIIESLTSNKEGELNRLCKFAENLQRNPSWRATKELFGFMQANCIDIDDLGRVICFKKVRNNYLDIYSGKMDNSVGQTLEVPRNQVDEDSDRTCSNGLHVCSSSYLVHFGNSVNNRVVKVAVWPEDFVAIPKDYNNAKARTSGYEVLEDVTIAYNSGVLNFNSKR